MLAPALELVSTEIYESYVFWWCLLLRKDADDCTGSCLFGGRVVTFEGQEWILRCLRRERQQVCHHLRSINVKNASSPA